MLTDEQVKKFQELYRNRFGEEISRDEAYDRGMKLLTFFREIRRPMSEEEFRKLEASASAAKKV